MPYIGTSPSNGVRRVHTYTATASQTTFTGASSEGVTLSYADTNYIDVFQNGVLLGSADYTSTSGTSVVLAQGASADDLIVIVVYDVFSVADTVSKTNGGSFDSAVTMSNNLTVSGAFTSQGIDDNADAVAITIDNSERVGIGMTSPTAKLSLPAQASGDSGVARVAIESAVDSNDFTIAQYEDTNGTYTQIGQNVSLDSGGSTTVLDSGHKTASIFFDGRNHGALMFQTGGDNASAERMRIDSSGNLLVGTSTNNTNVVGHGFNADGFAFHTRSGGQVLAINRQSDDGTLISFRQANAEEGTISVSGTTISYNGGHLGRWSRLIDNSKDTSIVKGTVMTNLDEMVEWSHEEVLWTDEDELPDGVSVGDVKKSAYTEDNEQLNKMAVSSVEGDANVSGVFVNWDNDDDYNDMMVAMTGDMVIRIAKGTKVDRGDLLMSAGDGTAKPQDDDIVRSKTIAKVTSTNVSHTYDDGTYLVPCVLMAC